MITHFVNRYDDYEHLMPVDNEIREVLKICSRRPYTVGTYRTDFVYDKEGQAKIIEITCRMSLNGIFQSAIFNSLSQKFGEKAHINQSRDVYQSIFDHLLSYTKSSKSIFVLQGADNKNESRIFVNIFEQAGYMVHEISYKDLSLHLSNIEEALIISELSFQEILSIPKKELEVLSRSNVINDFRTVFLIHDKRFFSVIGNDAFRASVLNKSEEGLFKKFYIPTYCYGESVELWEDAKINKSDWIIKHKALGKSVEIYAGIVTKQEEWEQLFEAENREDLVLQHWIPQRTRRGTIENINYEHYIAGTLLYFDNYFFGLGEFRTSSFPVINKTDHRKAFSFVTNKELSENLTLN
jgi:hypothetical protein